MNKNAPSKKSETLEVRLSLETKEAFMLLCRKEGRTASEVVRDYLEAELGSKSKPDRPRGAPWRIGVAAAAAGLAVGALAGPSIARPAWGGHGACERIAPTGPMARAGRLEPR